MFVLEAADPGSLASGRTVSGKMPERALFSL